MNRAISIPGITLATLLLASGLHAQEQVEVFDTPGNDTFTVPNGVTEITVEVWGAGGRGGSVSGNGNQRAGGGGGGAYGRVTLPVSPGRTFSLTVGAGSSSQNPGGMTSFGAAPLVAAPGGQSVPLGEGTGAAGGVWGGVGDTGFNGGRGGDAGVSQGNGFGGGGGSSAGSAASGNNGGLPDGAAAPAEGGDGGDGGDQNLNEAGIPGQQPGGGGGGAATFFTGQQSGPPSTSGGKGGDGRIRIRYTPQPVELILEYRMEQADWTGTTGEVLDTSGFERHGSPRDDADTDDEDSAIPGNPGTCRYGEFDGLNDGIDEPGAGAYLNGLNAITVMAWVYNTAPLSGNDNGIFFTNNPSGRDNRLGMRYDTAGFFGGGDNVIKAGVFTDDCNPNDECLQVETVSGVMVRDQWQHVAMTWVSGGDIKVFVDGAEVGISNVEGSGGNGTIDAVAALNIAQGATGDRWQGRIDEFRIFDSALSPDQIQEWKDTTAPCEILLPDHIRLLHPGSGLTCQASEITVQACIDPACSAFFDEEVTVDFTSPAGNWTPDPVTFSAETTVALQVTSPGFVTLDAASDPPANSPTRCFTGGTETCQMEWVESGFVIDVPDHVSDTAQPGTVAAVRSDNENQACTPGFSNETRTVGFWSGYVNPGAGTLPVAINGTAVSGNSPGTGIELNFDANGVAPIDVRYPDVGDMQLNARFEGSGEEDGLVMVGQTRFIARPDTFTLEIPANPGATDAGGPIFAVAAADFEVNVQARNASGDITPNFGRESPAEDVSLENALVAPVGGNNPPLVGGFGAFGEDCDGNPATGGTACGAFSWAEVGIIEITPGLAGGTYLGTADVVGDTSGPIGRFIPSHFNLSAGALTDRVELAECNAAFTYIGELFGADWTLDARNAGGATTGNYEGAFARLGTDALGIGADEDITVDSSSIDWAGGFGTASAEISADRGAPTGPYEDFQVGSAPVDADGVELAALDVDLSGDDVDDHGLVGTTELRFGRLAADNAVGSELGPLTLPLRAEFFENETWKNNTLDECTAMALADHVALTSSNNDSGDGTASVSVGSGSTSIQESDPVMLTEGRAGFTFSAPGSPGWVELSLLLDMDWHFLRDDLDDDGNFLDNPSARASFGLFEGDENRILLQEIPPR